MIFFKIAQVTKLLLMVQISTNSVRYISVLDLLFFFFFYCGPADLILRWQCHDFFRNCTGYKIIISGTN